MFAIRNWLVRLKSSGNKPRNVVFPFSLCVFHFLCGVGRTLNIEERA